MFWKPKPQFTVTIPQPCHENWQEMAQVERGRFCQACQTVVTDFTGLSDDEIIKHLEQAAGAKMCGRFLSTQTDRALLPEIKVHRISTFRKIAASVLMFYATVNEAIAQAPTTPHTTYTAANAKKTIAPVTGITITGKVIDFTGQGLPHLELQISGTDTIKTTDAYGRFKFYLPGYFAGREIVISPTQNGQLLLDSTGSFINDTKVAIDTLPFKTSLTIHLYPIDTLREIEAMSQVAKRTAIYNSGAVVMLPPKPELIPFPGEPDTVKMTSWQKFKAFFK